MTKSPNSPQNVKTTKTPDFLITWKESQGWLRRGERKVATQPWWATPAILVGMFLVGLGGVQFVTTITLFQRVLVVLMTMLGGVVFNIVANYTSPSIISLYPTYLRQARGQSVLRLEYTAVDYFRWTEAKGGVAILEVVGKEGWVVPISLRTPTLKEKVEELLQQLNLRLQR